MHIPLGQAIPTVSLSTREAAGPETSKVRERESQAHRKDIFDVLIGKSISSKDRKVIWHFDDGPGTALTALSLHGGGVLLD